MRYLIMVLLVVIANTSSLAQETPLFTHYFANPYIYNPAYAGIEGRPTVSLTHRRQWLGIDDAPVTSNFTFHSPIIAGFNLGFNVTQDDYGVFKTNGALLSFGYKIPLGFNHYFSFGLSGGGKFQNIDFTNVNLNDPALAGILDKNVKLDGNAGIAYHIGGLNLGFSIQNIFNTKIFPTETFDTGSLGIIKNYIITADYMIYFGNGGYIFQPYGSYKSYEGYDSQYEAGALIHIKHLLWIGGSYRQDFGIIGLVGIKLKGTFSLGYAYEMPAIQASGIDKSSHEVHLNLAFGKKKNRAKKYSTFLASQKPKKKKKEPKKVEEPVVKDTVQVVEEPLAPPIQDISDSLNQGGNKVRLIAGHEVPEDTIKVLPEQPVVDKTTPDPVPEELKPAVVTTKGNHPFELDKGHYIVVGAYGVAKNAIRANDKLLGQGYDSDFGFSSDKNLFYVFILGENTAEGTRKKRDELRKLPAFSKAWYLLVE